MKRILHIFLMSLLMWVGISVPIAHAQDTAQQFMRGSVTAILEEEQLAGNSKQQYTQTLEVERSDTHEKVTVEAGSSLQPLTADQRITVGRQVIISPQQENGQTVWALVDSNYRLPLLGALALLFFIIVIIVARMQGVLSIVGMLVSVATLSFYIIPQIIAGTNPILVSIISSIVIGSLSMYLSHGLTLKSHIAFGSIVLTLMVVAALSSLALALGHMSGMGSEEAVFLQLEPNLKLNMSGLLLAGIVLGALGILDDITISQTSIVAQLIKAKPHITFAELTSHAMQVGKDHIASLVNTLVLAYAATSLPLFLLLKLNNTRPLWVMLNDEMIAEEIIRTLAGSIGLVLAVPLTTFVAAFILLRQKNRKSVSK